MKISTTDPEAALSSKRGASEFAYYDNYLIDNRVESRYTGLCVWREALAMPGLFPQACVHAVHSSYAEDQLV